MSAPHEDIFVGLGDFAHAGRVFIRLLVASVLGAVVGLERLREHRPAGLRTHMLVALGAAMFTLVPFEHQMSDADLSRVIQGVAAGIGFLGAGTILKLSEEHKITGLTSAASIWMTAAAGMAVGAGWLWPALLGTLLAWIILHLLHRWEHWLGGPGTT